VDPFIVLGTLDLKRKIQKQEGKVRNRKEKKIAAIDLDAAREAAHERARKHFSCKSGSLLN
jgi:hypothetical protein